MSVSCPSPISASLAGLGERRDIQVVDRLLESLDHRDVPAIEMHCKGQLLLAWSDLNADGVMQAEERSVSNAFGSGDWMLGQSLRVSTGSGFVVAPKRFTEVGMPITKH